MKIFFIDPGTITSGFAIFNDGKLGERGQLGSDHDDPFVRCRAMVKLLFYNISVENPDKVICEYPIKGGPGWNSKTITILFHLCGMLDGILSHHDTEIEFIPANEWKGQLPKEVHQPRIIKKAKTTQGVTLEQNKKDMIDAVGLGMWYIKQAC